MLGHLAYSCNDGLFRAVGVHETAGNRPVKDMTICVQSENSLNRLPASVQAFDLSFFSSA